MSAWLTRRSSVVSGVPSASTAKLTRQLTSSASSAVAGWRTRSSPPRTGWGTTRRAISSTYSSSRLSLAVGADARPSAARAVTTWPHGPDRPVTARPERRTAWHASAPVCAGACTSTMPFQQCAATPVMRPPSSAATYVASSGAPRSVSPAARALARRNMEVSVWSTRKASSAVSSPGWSTRRSGSRPVMPTAPDTLRSARRGAPQLEQLEREAARQDADAAGVALTARHGAIDQDHEDPGEPARPLAPREPREHEPGLGVGRRPRCPVRLSERDRPHDDAVGAVAVGARPGEVPDAGHLAPAVIVAPAHREQIVVLGQPQHPGARRGRDADRLGRAVDDLEPVDAGGHELVEVLPMVQPVFRERRDADRPRAMQLGEQAEHAVGVAVVSRAVDQCHRAERDDVLSVDAPFDPGQEPDGVVDRAVEDDVVIGDIGRLEPLRRVPAREVRDGPAGTAVV